MSTHVLILCTHNSARSVLAEGMLGHWPRRLGRDVVAHSAGSAPKGRINPFALEALRNAGVDTAGTRSKSWDEFSADGAPPLSIVITQKLAVALLEGQGHSVTVANNGREVLTALETASFDLVLMDVQMPEMDGLEATTTIRDREKRTGTHLPIIAMTAHALKGDRERCLEAGMDGYIVKPIRTKDLFDAIDRLAAPPVPCR